MFIFQRYTCMCMKCPEEKWCISEEYFLLAGLKLGTSSPLSSTDQLPSGKLLINTSLLSVKHRIYSENITMYWKRIIIRLSLHSQSVVTHSASHASSYTQWQVLIEISSLDVYEYNNMSLFVCPYVSVFTAIIHAALQQNSGNHAVVWIFWQFPVVQRMYAYLLIMLLWFYLHCNISTLLDRWHGTTLNSRKYLKKSYHTHTRLVESHYGHFSAAVEWL